MDQQVKDELTNHRLVPVIVLDDVAAARGLGEALVAGGLPIAEITLRTPSAMSVLGVMAQDRSLLVGAGTVLDVEQVERAAEAGARFIVSPGFDADVVLRSHELGMLAIPGVATATEVQSALRAGARLLKFFPAGPLGGTPALHALAAPFPGASFVPTGGIAAGDLVSYLQLSAVAAVGGSFMVPSSALAQGDFDTITHRVADAVAIVGRARTPRGDSS